MLLLNFCLALHYEVFSEYDLVYKYLYSEKDRLDILVSYGHLFGCSFGLFSGFSHNGANNLPYTDDLEKSKQRRQD